MIVAVVLSCGSSSIGYAQDDSKVYADLDSVMEAMSIPQIFDFIDSQKTVLPPKEIPRWNAFVKQVWRRCMLTEYEDMSEACDVVGRYAWRQEQFEMARLLMRTIYMDSHHFKPKDQVHIQKFLAVYQNKAGFYARSLETLNEGLKMAKKLEDEIHIRDFYHHLVSEYAYLVLEDTSLRDEFWRLNDICLKYSYKLKDSFAISYHLLNEIERPHFRGKPFQVLRKSLSTLGRPTRFTEKNKSSILQEFANVLYRARYHDEYIQHMLDLLEHEEHRETGNYAMLADSYFHIGDHQNSRKYAHLAQKKFHTSTDNDRKRLVLSIMPELYSDLGEYKNSCYFGSLRDKLFRKQFVEHSILSVESERFHDELEEVKSQSAKQAKVNKFLWFSLIGIHIIVVMIIFFGYKIKRKNTIISAALYDLERTNNYLEVAQKDIESFAYTAAHDVKNPLHSIRGFLDLIKVEEENLKSASLEYMGYIDLSIQNLTNILDNIIGYAKVQSDTIVKEPIDLYSIYTQISIMLNEQIESSSARFIVSEKLPTIMGSKNLLTQLFMNLLSNAIKYGPRDAQPIIEMRAHSHGDTVSVEVIDNGIGIPKENLEKIFELFDRATNTGNIEGTGVGLAVCKKIMSLHNGMIKVRNNKGKPGTTFTVSFPSMESIKAKTSPKAERIHSTISKETMDYVVNLAK